MEQKLNPLPVRFYDKQYNVKLQAFQADSQWCFDCFYFPLTSRTCKEGFCVEAALSNDTPVQTVIFKEIEND